MNSIDNFYGGSWAKYENVQVKEKVNKLTVKYYSNDANIISIRIGSKDADPIVDYSAPNSNNGWVEYSVPLTTTLDKGTYDIYATVSGSSYLAVQYFSFGYDAAYEDITPIEHDYTKIYAGDYNNSLSGDTGKPVIATTEWGNGNSINNFYGGSWASYEAVDVKETVNKLTIKYYTGGPNVISIRIGSEDAEPIVNYATQTENAWAEFSVPLTTSLEPGEYDIYATVSGSSYLAINYFGFSYDATLEAPLNYEKIPAGRFDASYKGTEGSYVPAAFTSGSDYALKNVYASNWVMYEDVKIEKDVNVMNIALDTNSRYTYVDLYINAPNTENGGEHLARFNTKNTGWAMVERKTQLTRTLAAGTYDIYLVFDGKRNNDGNLTQASAACDIYWFGFDYVNTIFYGGTFADASANITSGTTTSALGSFAGGIADGGYIHYANVEIKEKVNIFKLCYDSNGAGIGFELRLASQEGEVISRVATDATDWGWDEKYAVLENPIKAGTYDVYITINTNGKAADISWISFEYDKDFDLSYEKKVNGGSFDPETVVQGAGLPPSQAAYDSTVLSNTFGSNAVQYKSVEITNPVNTFSTLICAGGGAGNTINLRVGSVDGEILATIQSENTNWKTIRKTTKMTKPLPAGTYDIWLTFDNGKDKSCDMNWFSLGYAGEEETGDISITEVTFSDVDFGEPVEELKSIDAVTVSAKVNSTWPLSGKKYVAYAALYEGGKLMEVYPADGTAAANTTTDINFVEAFTGFKADSKIKVFVWSGEEGEDLQPYAAADGVKTEIAY